MGKAIVRSGGQVMEDGVVHDPEVLSMKIDEDIDVGHAVEIETTIRGDGFSSLVCLVRI